MARYRFYATPDHRVICVSSYAGRKVRGVAICDENDEYDFEKGKALAQARVDLEIARRRLKRAEGKRNEALDACGRADAHYEEMVDYVCESSDAVKKARINLARMLSEM